MTVPTSLSRAPCFFSALTEADRAALTRRATERTLAPGEAAYCQDDESRNLFIIRSGFVKAHHAYESGASLTVAYYGEGMLVGAHGFTDRPGPHVWTAEALGPCRVLWLRREDFLAVVDRSPAALRALLAVTEHKAEQLRQIVRMLAAPSLEEKLELALRHLGGLYPRESGGEIEIDRLFTHQEIAEMIMVSRQSVTTALFALDRAGRIRRRGRRLFVRAATPEGRMDPPPARGREARRGAETSRV